MLILAGKIHIEPESVDQFSAEAEKLVADTLSNDRGCIEYGMWRSLGEAGSFHFFEVWDGPESLAAHGASTHYKQFSEQLGNLGVIKAEMTRYEASPLD